MHEHTPEGSCGWALHLWTVAWNGRLRLCSVFWRSAGIYTDSKILRTNGINSEMSGKWLKCWIFWTWQWDETTSWIRPGLPGKKYQNPGLCYDAWKGNIARPGPCLCQNATFDRTDENMLKCWQGLPLALCKMFKQVTPTKNQFHSSLKTKSFLNVIQFWPWLSY